MKESKVSSIRVRIATITVAALTLRLGRRFSCPGRGPAKLQ
jgi:hypothetical protein